MPLYYKLEEVGVRGSRSVSCPSEGTIERARASVSREEKAEYGSEIQEQESYFKPQNFCNRNGPGQLQFVKIVESRKVVNFGEVQRRPLEVLLMSIKRVNSVVCRLDGIQVALHRTDEDLVRIGCFDNR